MITSYGTDIAEESFGSYIECLVNKVYKILPLRENNEPTLQQYMKSLQRELLGCQSLLPSIEQNQQFFTILSIIQNLIDHECAVPIVKSDVFKAINLLKRIQRECGSRGGDADERMGHLR